MHSSSEHPYIQPALNALHGAPWIVAGSFSLCSFGQCFGVDDVPAQLLGLRHAVAKAYGKRYGVKASGSQQVALLCLFFGRWSVQHHCQGRAPVIGIFHLDPKKIHPENISRISLSVSDTVVITSRNCLPVVFREHSLRCEAWHLFVG